MRIGIVIFYLMFQSGVYSQRMDQISAHEVDSFTTSYWSLRFVVSLASLKDSSAILGVRSDATQDYDAQYDVPRPPDPPGDYIEAYFPHSGSNWPSLLGSKFACDFSQPNNPRWIINIESTLPSGEVTLSWDTTELNKLPDGYHLFIKDSVSGLITVIRSTMAYTFSYDGPRLFTIWVDYSFSTLNVYSRWNLISLPREMIRPLKSEIFPMAVSKAFCYENQYVSKDTLELGKGYWLKFNSNESISIAGVSYSSLAIPVFAGWNLIGSLDRDIVAPQSMNIASKFFEYNGGYVSVDTLKSGKGYWVKIKQDGELVLGSSSIITKIEDSQQNYGKLIFSDSKGNRQQLFFGRRDGVFDVNEFELPPLPPEGMFDVRFVSGRNAEMLSEQNTMEYTVHVSTDVYPLNIELDLQNSDFQYILENGNQKTELFNHQIIHLTLPSELMKIKVYSTNNKPERFILEQNYPNPFNPSTKIIYYLNHPSTVKFTLFDFLGKEILNSDQGVHSSGRYEIDFNFGKMDLVSGIYYYRCDLIEKESGKKFSYTKKMIFIK